MHNSFSALNDNIRTLNEYDLRPKRTTYDNMWLYVNQRDDNNPRNNIQHPAYNEILTEAKIKLPKLTRAESAVQINQQRLNLQSGKINEFLMKNWYSKREEANTVTSSYQSYDFERRGRNGPYQNLTQAMRCDGSKFLFIQGPRLSSANLKKTPNFDDSSEYQNQYYGRTITKALLDKLARERLDIQQKYAVENGNWNLMR